MKYRVNENCIGCGLCADTCPEVFVLTDSGVAAAVNEAGSESEAAANAAMEECPVDAIEEA